MQHKVEICGVNTAKLKVLKNEEMQELLRRSKEGDQRAREELISGNLRLVLSVIQRFANRGENADDLFQVGCIGLIKAIDNFNTEFCVCKVADFCDHHAGRAVIGFGNGGIDIGGGKCRGNYHIVCPFCGEAALFYII